MRANEMVIVVTVMPATATKGTRYKGVCDEACQVVPLNFELDAKANAWLAAQACCTSANLEAREGEEWRPWGSVMPNPTKPGSWVIVARRTL
jgi:hypothetical protein